MFNFLLLLLLDYDFFPLNFCLLLSVVAIIFNKLDAFKCGLWNGNRNYVQKCHLQAYFLWQGV